MSLFTQESTPISQRKTLQTGGIDQSGVRTRGGFVSWFSDQCLLLGTSQRSRDLGQGAPGESAGQVLGPG